MWRNELDLSSEDVHFFALSKVSQRERVERFLKESMGAGSKIAR
jgi:hypothetical protein